MQNVPQQVIQQAVVIIQDPLKEDSGKASGTTTGRKMAVRPKNGCRSGFVRQQSKHKRADHHRAEKKRGERQTVFQGDDEVRIGALLDVVSQSDKPGCSIIAKCTRSSSDK